MTHEERHALRHAVDQARRERLAGLALRLCAGCGTEYHNSTVGCRTCHDRHRTKKRRKNEQKTSGCRACGQPLYEHTPRCLTCYERHRRRARSVR